MEFDFDVHKIFLEPITKLDCTLNPSRRPLISSGEAQKQIVTVIDEIGKLSAKAQRLPAPITSASRMQSNKHHLYILKDCTPKTAGRGAVIGFLKVGSKKLFVLDHSGSHIEAEPLCILDFYIHESLQRNGFGKELFTFMLRAEQIEPQHLAIDRPSDKFLSFLRKHYNLRSTIPQVNNFVVFEGFFRDRKALMRKLPPKRAEGDIKPYSLSERDFLKQEEGLPWPFNQSPSSLNRAGSLGSSPTRPGSRPPPGEEDFVKSLRACRPHSLHRAANGEHEDPSQRRRTSSLTLRDSNLSRGLVAQKSGYSRHATPPLLTRGQTPADITENHTETEKRFNRGMVPEHSHHFCGNSQNNQLSPDFPKVTQKPSSSPPMQKALGTFNHPIHERPSGHPHPDASKYPWDKGSWTVLGPVLNAQWVKRKQELRGTRPW
ncbi:alpha-tubulin N-acetyltransferase 1 isoform X1 [Pelobates fuscus]|uniref:alpha-tubulin N-acetyltransferase 1 isoform X1 n=1 Tax=Pelobates fuscus TaxID=191477 RepID=UPI002FE45412